MGDGINKQIILGNLGGDPEYGITGTNRPFCKFSVATSESWKDKQTGSKHERVEWHTIAVFDKLAEICNTYLKKGSKVYLEGKTKTSSWVDANTQEKRYRKDVIAHEMRMLDSAPGDHSQAPQQQAPQQQAPRQQAPRQQAPQQSTRYNQNGTAVSPLAAQQPQQQPRKEPPMHDGFDDDIPF